MEVTTKELRIQPGKIIDQVVNGQEVTVTYRGKALARIVPFGSGARDEEAARIFGMWKAHDDALSVEQRVRELRKGRPL
jgi:prevent-host-death family protein